MKNDKSLHVHTGGLIIFIIILMILFKVDLKSIVKSQQFQNNISYVSDYLKSFWNKYSIMNLLKMPSSYVNDFVDTSVSKLKDEGRNTLNEAIQNNQEKVSNLLKLPTSPSNNN